MKKTKKTNCKCTPNWTTYTPGKNAFGEDAYCGSTSVWGTNPWQVEYVNCEQAGYEFEKGRIRAREESENQ